ncbi:MAG: protein translocase subunit SecD [Puniceicoccales bacterium]|jgi:SecD/SecF fusion protein|nr:protein translocase subunit SecD [Puniceicoccales bacterium]
MRMRASFRRILLSLVVVVAAIFSVLPVRDRPFGKYMVSCVTREKQTFDELLQRASERLSSGQSKSLYLAIRTIAGEENVDLARFFGRKNVADIKDLREKNKILLDSILADSKSKIKQGLDLKGGVSFTLRVDDPKFDNFSAIEKTKQLDKAVDIIRQRIDGLGVAEPLVRIFGNNCIEVQLPGISIGDNPEIVDAIKKPAKLEFRLLHGTLVPKSKSEQPPIGYEVFELGRVSDNRTSERSYAFVKKIPEMTGNKVKHAGVAIGQYGEYEVSLTMTDEGAKIFEKITAANINRQLGIVLDGKLYSAPVIRSPIPSGRASISGRFTQRDALELANVLNNPLEVALKFVELNEIGPSMAEDAMASSLRASLIGASVVALFMLAYYRVAGAVSLVAILANMAITLGVMASIGATLTLPGIAALVLTIGMAVDANILIFERMREELLCGKPVSVALAAGHGKAFSSIVDANLTTLLAALILIHFGTGPIKGFGVILAIGIFATIFCALVLSRGLLEVLVEGDIYKKLIPNFRVRPLAFDFLKHWKSIFAAYAVAILACTAAVASRNTKIYGIDFTGGDEVTLKFDKKIPIGEINRAAAESGIGEIASVYQKSAADNSEILRVQTAEGRGAETFACLKNNFEEANLSLVKKTEIGSSVGQGIKLNALISIALAMLGIMAYVAFRFEMGYGVGAVVSTVLDVILTVLIYLSLGHQISAPMVASILMVVGYSINDTIIVFDRIREELKSNEAMSLCDVINLSIVKTISRTVLTSASTFLSALALYLFGSGVIVDFALVFMIGIAVGTFSSIFVASPIFHIWHGGDRRTIPVAI